MKKTIVIALSAVLVSTSVFAANFSPKLLRLSAPSKIAYNFDGKPLEIPVTVSGFGAGVIFCVYTQGKGASIGKVQNGYLGWHYVNKIDTAMYISSVYNIDVGTSKIIWDGKGKQGALVPADVYTYYLWAYDNRNAKIYVARYMTSIQHNLGEQVHIQEKDVKGLPLANPFVLMQNNYNISGNRAKWVIGGDPSDSSLTETTRITMTNWGFERYVTVAPTDFSSFFISGGMTRTVGSQKGVWKMKWVPNGNATIDVTWGANGFAGISRPWDDFAGPDTDGTYVYWANNNYHAYNNNLAEAELYAFDLTDGSTVKKFDLASWWCRSDDFKAGGFLNGGPNGLAVTRDGNMLLGSHASCLTQMVNPLAESEKELVVWANQNGDLIYDHNFSPTALLRWVCNDYKTPPFTTSFQADANNFVVGAVYDIGAVSFGLEGPDGTGIANLAYAGETAARKYYVNYIDYGSPFDGMYTDNQGSVPPSTADPGNARVVDGFMFIGHDSVKGVISQQIGVEETAPSAFTVSQNTPNPFNPSTSINFTLAKAGKVTVEIFNVSGQKVETLVNSTMNAGAHSVNWNASRQSAGIYFYTVKSDNASKTMKMTLLK